MHFLLRVFDLRNIQNFLGNVKEKFDIGRPQVTRGVITFNCDTHARLYKNAPMIRNTHEVRLAMYNAIKNQKFFVLQIPEGTKVEASITELMTAHGGEILFEAPEDYTVSISHFTDNQEEVDTWVLGTQSSWNQLKNSLKSDWLKSTLQLGSTFDEWSLQRLEKEISGESLDHRNMDQELVQKAIKRMINDCKRYGGYLLIQ
ncbi:hypothetical protein ACKC9G_08085 [Pokkaliibacter sp. CJK22405]|uniref:hypothetical protein n=1 Tax=Pokkaliibacter sp. CJK22405 TaxID=3384615 RepID=UPI0039848660